MQLLTTNTTSIAYNCGLILCFLLPLLQPAIGARTKHEKVLLSDIRALTLRKDAKTSHNRVPAIPQLNLIGGNARGYYKVETLRCKNAGAGYSDDDIQWTCTADLPTEFKLGSTDVICEGFANSNDPYVLKGSCGVEYRLMLTDAGEERYLARGKSGDQWVQDTLRSKSGDWAPTIFWVIFVAVVGWMIYSAFIRNAGTRRPTGRAGGGNFGGWGGGGGGGDDPPPPYDYHPPPPKPKASSSTRGAGAGGAGAQQNPGFWTGALGGAVTGAAATYFAGNRGARTEPQQPRNQGSWDNGEGSSRTGGMGRTTSSGSSSTPSYGSSRHESSGFGGTSRR